MWTYEYPEELAHYGVIGMKWGIRRARKQTEGSVSKHQMKKNAKIAGANAKREAVAQLNNSSKKHTLYTYNKVAREAIRDAMKESINKDKATNQKIDIKNANKLYSKQSKEANKRVVEMSTGKALAESYLLSSYGALKYNEIRAKGDSRGKAAVKAYLYAAGNAYTGGLNSTVKYLDNRFARK